MSLGMFGRTHGLADNIVADAATGAAGGSILGPIGSIAGAAGGVLSSIFGGSAQEQAAKDARKAAALQKKAEAIAVAAQQQQDVYNAQMARQQAASEEKLVLVGLAGIAGLVVVGALAYKIAKGRQS